MLAKETGGQGYLRPTGKFTRKNRTVTTRLKNAPWTQSSRSRHDNACNDGVYSGFLNHHFVVLYCTDEEGRAPGGVRLQGKSFEERMHFQQMNRGLMWPTPIIVYDYDCVELNKRLYKDLKEICEERNNTDGTTTVSGRQATLNVGMGYDSVKEFYHELLYPTFEHAYAQVQAMCQDVGCEIQLPTGRSGNITWAVDYAYDGYNKIHHHAHYDQHGVIVLSSVYCVYSDFHAEGSQGATELRCPMMYYQTWGKVMGMELKLKPGQFLVFPSYLDHASHPFRTPGMERVIIASDFVIQPETTTRQVEMGVDG